MAVVTVFDHCAAAAAGVEVHALQELATEACPICLEAAIDTSAPLHGLVEIEISLVGDEEIARVHGEFMGDPTPTDVITFHHGEILVSPETAERQRGAHGYSLQRELTLYAIHGLLHLAGHEDATAEGAARMKDLQEAILRQVMPAA